MKKLLKKIFFPAVLLAFSASAVFAAGNTLPRREFRGAWLHTVYQDGYKKRTTEENKAYLRNQLDSLKLAGINAVIFQVRPQSDAFYRSKIEPWSRYLTNNGMPPKPLWDPLAFMVDEAHKRGMELHAWLNPYRVTTSAKQTVPRSHIYHKHPERFVRYDGKLYFDPGQPQNRHYIAEIVADIIKRYDVDGIHFDDYFYPYPVKNLEFDDKVSYSRYGKGMKKADWRRKNVDDLIEEVHQVIAAYKPWVRFGISPFGIWRNKSTDPRGSDTRGLQNYDALYADPLHWAAEGWIDYQMPQLYWDLAHKSASYLVLVDWWNRNANGRHVYVGQDVERTMKFADLAPSAEKTQLRHKIDLTRAAENIQGTCWWPGYYVTANMGGVADSLLTIHHAGSAIVPSYPWISENIPATVSGLKAQGRNLSWDAPEVKNKVDDVVRYAIYLMPDGAASVEDAQLVDITPVASYKLSSGGTYVVTALDRVNNESAPSKPVKVK